MNSNLLGVLKRMSQNHEILLKMDAMSRRALASLEAMQKAITDGNRGMIGKHMIDAENALSYLKSDLNLHDSLAKSVPTDQAHTTYLGVIPQYDNTASDYTGTENAVVKGVSRAGRASGFYTPHRVV